jgi:hypothetical protein
MSRTKKMMVNQSTTFMLRRIAWSMRFLLTRGGKIADRAYHRTRVEKGKRRRYQRLRT